MLRLLIALVLFSKPFVFSCLCFLLKTEHVSIACTVARSFENNSGLPFILSYLACINRILLVVYVVIKAELLPNSVEGLFEKGVWLLENRCEPFTKEIFSVAPVN